MKLPVIAAIALALSFSCTPAERQEAKTALDIANTICVIANAESSDVTVQAVCGIEQALLPDVRRLLDAHRKKLAAAKCGSVSTNSANADAGAGKPAGADGGAP